MAKKASRAAEMATFERGVLEIEMQLAKEVAGVCRDYCAEVWAKSLNWARVPVDFELREAENIYFSKDIREVSEMFPSLVADPLPPLEQLSTIQGPPLRVEVSTGDGKGKEVQLLTKVNQSEDNLTIKDMVLKAKDAKSKSKAGDTQSKVANPKKDLPQANAQLQGFCFLSFYMYFSFVVVFLPLFVI